VGCCVTMAVPLRILSGICSSHVLPCYYLIQIVLIDFWCYALNPTPTILIGLLPRRKAGCIGVLMVNLRTSTPGGFTHKACSVLDFDLGKSISYDRCMALYRVYSKHSWHRTCEIQTMVGWDKNIHFHWIFFFFWVGKKLLSRWRVTGTTPIFFWA
jgi:hypothetical protein